MEDSLNQIVAVVFGRAITRRQFSEAFDRVIDSSNWKNPIDRVLLVNDDRDMALIREAVVFFTGSVPTFEKLRRANCYRVRAAGYYATIGA
jgi:hypothetical protein